MLKKHNPSRLNTSVVDMKQPNMGSFSEEDKDKNFDIPCISNSSCSHEFIGREYPSQPYGTCLVCGRTILTN